MTLYSADISKLAQPVKSVTTQNEPAKKKVRKTTKPLPLTEPEPAVAAEPKKKNPRKRKEPVEEQSDESIEPPVEEAPKKKLRTKKVKPEPTPEAVPEPVAAAPTPKKKRVRKACLEPIAEESLDQTVEPPTKRVRKQPVKSDVEKGEPPVWFKKYVEGVKKEEAAHKEIKVPAKQVKIEAQETAQKSWENGLTRDRVSNEIDSHMNRMYSMIFARR